MFGCIGRLLSSLLLILLGAYLHANWPAIRRELRDRVPDLLPAPASSKGGTVVESLPTIRVVISRAHT